MSFRELVTGVEGSVGGDFTNEGDLQKRTSERMNEEEKKGRVRKGREGGGGERDVPRTLS